MTNGANRVIDIVTQSGFLEPLELDEYKSVGERLSRLLRRTLGICSDKQDVVGQIMTENVKTVRATKPVIELVPLMADAGLNHLPLVDQANRFVGIVIQSEILAALYDSRLAGAESLSV